jgi:predicted RNA-binding protein associated with RNAse of E/G family
LIFNHKSSQKLYIDLGDLQNETENLTNYLQKHLKVTASPDDNRLAVDSDDVSLPELEHNVKKFVYHRDLNRTHWVSNEGSTVKINRFKDRPKKKTKTKKAPPHQTAVQSWGL